MKPFDALTPAGQTQRLRTLARAALAEYDGEIARVALLRRTFNTLFRVGDAKGVTTALRVGAAERIHTSETEAVEGAWLRAIRADTDIDVALPVANRAGADVTTANAAGVPEPRTCMRFEWARGRRLGEVVIVELARKTGELLAQLHEHGAEFDGGRPQPVIVGDNVISFVLADRIPRTDARYGTLFAEAMDRAQAAIDSLWARPPHAPHLLHGDLHPNNILVWRGNLTPIDFQDALWGFEIQDVAITMSALEAYADAPALAAALRTGYERTRQWPADDAILLGELIGARHLSQLNLGYNIRRPGLEQFVARQGEWIRNWMHRAR